MGEGKARGQSRRKWIVAFGVALGAAMSFAVGCALDDTAITALGGDGSVGGDSSVFDAGGGDASDGAPACVAKTCANYPSDCHPSLDDGCGSTIDCSTKCPGGQACVQDGGIDASVSFFCNGPPICQDAGAPGGNCNTLTNPGNGLQTNCGGCNDTGFTCNTNTCSCGGTTCSAGTLCCSGGTPNCNDANNACCLRKACADDRTQCSTTFSNGCGGTLNCQAPSNCVGGQVCDTANSQCCTVSTTCGTNCNTSITTNCNTSLSCGACGSGTCDNTHHCCANNVCGGTCCTAGQVCNGSACCTRDSMSTTCGGGPGKCGTVNDNCGVPTNCGDCSDGQLCFGTGGMTCVCGDTTCNPAQTCHINGSGKGSCTP